MDKMKNVLKFLQTNTLLVIMGIAVIIAILYTLGVWDEKRPYPQVLANDTPTATSQVVTTESGGSQTVSGSQKILSLVPGQAIQWVSIPRGICYNTSLPKDGECVAVFLNDESRSELKCQGRQSRHSGPIFRIGFATDHSTTVAVDMFPCG